MLSPWESRKTPVPRLRGIFNAPGRSAIRADVVAWAGEQHRATLLWRGALWLYLLFAGARLVLNPATGDIFGFFTLVVHEAGHALFSYLGEFLGIAGGSLAQILAPLYVLSTFWRQRDYFALCIGGYWLASSLFNLSIYIGDARARQLELVSPFSFGEEPIHDWNWLLTHMHLLPFDTVLSWTVRLAATVIFVLSMTCGARMLWEIGRR